MAASNTSHVTARPSAVQQATTYNYLSTIDILKPQVASEYARNWGDEDFTGWMEVMGVNDEDVPVGGQDYIHYETPGRLNQFVIAGTVTTGAATGDALVTLDAASIVGGKSAPIVGQTVELKDGSLAYIYSKPSETQIGVRPYGSATLSTAIVTGDYLLLRWLEVGERSTATGSLTPYPAKYTNNLVMLRRDYSVSDMAMSAESWVEVPMSDGTTGFLWYYEGENQTFRRFNADMDFQHLFGRQITNTNLTALGVRGSRALLPAIKAGGNSIGYGSTFDITVFDVATQVIDKEGGARESVWMCDIRQSQAADKFMHDYNTGGGIVWGDFTMDEEVKLQMGFTTFKYSEHTFHKKNYRGFNNEAVFGAPAASSNQYNNYGVIMPLDMKDDAKLPGKKVPSIRKRYAPIKGKKVFHWTTGALANTPTSATSELNFHYETNQSLETFGINRFIELGANL